MLSVNLALCVITVLGNYYTFQQDFTVFAKAQLANVVKV